MHRYFEINQGGHNIRCKLYCREQQKDIRHAVIFCSGFGGHKDNSAAEKFAQRLITKRKDSVMVTFNWPCHGDDVKKKLALEDCEVYLEAVIAHVRRKYSPEKLFCYATSFGGYLTLKYIIRHGNPFGRIALRCPAVDMHRILTENIMTADDLERLRKGKDIPVGFDRKVMVGQQLLDELERCSIAAMDFLDYAEDILVIHGTADEIVSFESSRSFAENNLTEFIAVEGADHRFRNPSHMEQAIKSIFDFFSL